MKKVNSKDDDNSTYSLYGERDYDIVGFGYPSSRKPDLFREDIVELMTEGDDVFIEKEPDNPFDANAVVVLDKSGVDIGYISRYETETLHDIVFSKYFKINAKIKKIFWTKDGEHINCTVSVRIFKNEDLVAKRIAFEERRRKVWIVIVVALFLFIFVFLLVKGYSSPSTNAFSSAIE